jgi:hypothetical protein
LKAVTAGPTFQGIADTPGNLRTSQLEATFLGIAIAVAIGIEKFKQCLAMPRLRADSDPDPDPIGVQSCLCRASLGAGGWDAAPQRADAGGINDLATVESDCPPRR